jgi:hypothetical protein
MFVWNCEIMFVWNCEIMFVWNWGILFVVGEFSQWVAGTSPRVAGTSHGGTGTNNVVTSASQRMTAKSHKNFYKFTQDEIVDYFSLFDTHNDFDVEHFKQLGLDNFKYTEVVKETKRRRGRPNQQNKRERFVMQKFLAAFLKFLNEVSKTGKLILNEMIQDELTSLNRVRIFCLWRWISKLKFSF